MRILLCVFMLSCAAYAQLTYTETTASRNINTVYQNLSAHPILLSFTEGNTALVGSPASTDIQLLVGPTNPPTQQVTRDSVTQNFGSAGNADAVVGIVPANYYWEVVFSGNNTPFNTPNVSETTLDTATGGAQALSSCTLSTICHNTTSGVVWEAVTALTGVSAGTITMVSDSSATPTTQVGNATNDAGKYMWVLAPVLPGNYFQVTGTNITINSWVETTTPGLVLTQNNVTGSRNEDQTNYVNFNYVAGTALFAAIVSDMGSFRSAGSHISGNGASLGTLVDIIGITRNASAHTETFIPVPRGWSYGDRNDNAGSTLGSWIEYPVAGGFTGAGEKHRRRVY